MHICMTKLKIWMWAYAEYFNSTSNEAHTHSDRIHPSKLDAARAYEQKQSSVVYVHGHVYTSNEAHTHSVRIHPSKLAQRVRMIKNRLSHPVKLGTERVHISKTEREREREREREQFTQTWHAVRAYAQNTVCLFTRPSKYTFECTCHTCMYVHVHVCVFSCVLKLNIEMCP